MDVSVSLMKQDILVGGMALLEGVMMKSDERIGIAVRDPDGKIVTKQERFVSRTRNRILGLPFIRGIVNMAEMLYLGMKSLNYSADIALEEEEGSSNVWLMALSLIVGIGLAVVLFKFLPFGGAWLAGNLVDLSGPAFYILEGLIKIGLFIGYLYLISLLPDIKRVFQYHGAEHKTVACHEQKKGLTAKNVAGCSRFHPRCGTSFVVFVILLSIVVYAFIPAELSFWVRFGLRILLLPVLASVSYEILRFSAKRPDSVLFRIISAPGLWTQRITTGEPDKGQIQVAIKALRTAS